MKKLSLILAIMLFASCLSCAFTGVAFAAYETLYSSVLYDLQQDDTFNAANYPVDATNKKVFDVFQIAESVDSELFVYVYQPLEDKFTASEIRISRTIEPAEPKDYKLTLLDRSGTLAKYKVDGFVVGSEEDRMYYIIQIARPWDKDVDEETGNDNKVSTVAYAVGKQFRAITVNGSVQYSEAHEDVMTITAKYCGYIRNFAGWVGIATENTDSHFVAFDTDIPMDKLMEATVTYDSIGYSERVITLTGLTMPGTYKEYADTKVNGKEVKLNANKEVQTPVIGLFGKEYSWTEIQTVNEFLELEEVTDEVREQVTGKKWVLRFALTDVVNINAGNLTYTERYATRVNNASILRLKFITNGVTYDLGVVDNKQTEGNKPSSPNPDSNFEQSIKTIMDVLDQIGKVFDAIGKFFTKYWWVGVILGVVILLGVLAIFVKPFAKILWWILKIIFYIVTLPVWLIIWGVRAIKKGRDRNG